MLGIERHVIYAATIIDPPIGDRIWNVTTTPAAGEGSLFVGPIFIGPAVII